jgi:hypothetical protein
MYKYLYISVLCVIKRSYQKFICNWCEMRLNYFLYVIGDAGKINDQIYCDAEIGL